MHSLKKRVHGFFVCKLPQPKPDDFAGSLGEGASGETVHFAIQPETVPPCQKPNPLSLSARFGLTVTFQRPEKARFETILAELAKQHGIDMPMDQLLVKAEAFAIRAGGRSPRVAKQFIEQCEAGVQK